MLHGCSFFTVTFRIDFNDYGMMHQAVNGGHGHDGIGKDAIPLTERLVGRDDHAAGFVAVGDQLEQGMGFKLALFDIPHIIEDYNRVFVEFIQQGVHLHILAGPLEFLHDRGGRKVAHSDALFNESVSDRCGQVGFAHATGAEKKQIFSPFDPVCMTGQTFDLFRGQIRCLPEVKTRQGLADREAGLSGQSFNAAAAPLCQLLLAQSRQVLIRCPAFLFGFGQEVLPMGGHGRQPQLSEQYWKGCAMCHLCTAFA